MIIDDYDLIILKEFLKLKENEETTTWKIMKKIFPNGRDRENMKVKCKIKKMSKHGIYYVGGNPKIYTLIKDNVKFKKVKIENTLFNFIALKVDGLWALYQIN